MFFPQNGGPYPRRTSGAPATAAAGGGSTSVTNADTPNSRVGSFKQGRDSMKKYYTPCVST